jgi:hypothetical protein
MRVHDGKYECAWCEAVLDAELDTKPTATIISERGKPTVRVLRVGREEIHRCERPPT